MDKLDPCNANCNTRTVKPTSWSYVVAIGGGIFWPGQRMLIEAGKVMTAIRCCAEETDKISDIFLCKWTRNNRNQLLQKCRNNFRSSRFLYKALFQSRLTSLSRTTPTSINRKHPRGRSLIKDRIGTFGTNANCERQLRPPSKQTRNIYETKWPSRSNRNELATRGYTR